ncbi:hypothetical protein ACIO1C_08690 [Streptomyces sp. NPDC087420]|uniref:hypothetical protein n=1 Tax=Streptomyces sp. NPDC087420 TaxID=3365785 RepID=UPI003833155A
MAFEREHEAGGRAVAQGTGTYGNGPYGWGGWAPPKPGVIPLGPLGLSEIMNGAFATVGRYWKPLLGVACAAYGLAALVAGVAVGIAVAGVGLSGLSTLGDLDAEWGRSAGLLVAVCGVGAVALVAVLAATALTTAACPAVVQNAVLGRPVTFRTLWRQASARVPAVLGVVLVTGLIGMVPALLLVTGVAASVVAAVSTNGPGNATAFIALGFAGFVLTAPPAVWLWTRFILAPTAAVVESQGPLTSLRRSSLLVRGSWWRTFGITLLAYAAASAAAMVVQQALNVLGLFASTALTAPDNGTDTALALVAVLVPLGLAVQLIAQIATTVFPQLVLSLIYMDRRIRTENLAPHLAEASTTVPTPPAP